MPNFKAKLKEISESYTNCILDTKSQTLDSIENEAFATPFNRPAEAVPGSSSNTSSRGIFDDFSDTEEDTLCTSDEVMTRITTESDHFANIKLKKDQEKTKEPYILVEGKKMQISLSI